MLIPYHLRAHKEIDRGIFLDTLSIAAQQWGVEIQNAVYVGMGAISFEDFVSIYDRLGVTQMFSIEQDIVIHARQMFNQPLSKSCIVPLKMSVSDFLTDQFNRGDQPHIVWLDYDNPKQIRQQLGEFGRFLSKLQEHDVIKITLSIPKASKMREASKADASPREIQDAAKFLQDKLMEYTPKDIDIELSLSIREKGAGYVLFRSAILAAGENSPHGLSFRPLNALTYSDSSIRFSKSDVRSEMLTLIGVLVKENSENFNLSGIPFSLHHEDGMGVPYEVNPPMITPCEKIAIDKFLPAESNQELERAHDILFRRGLKFHKNKEESLSKFKCYAEIHRYYPDYRNIRP